ncbi:retrovirus-related pol polyprotein from transposon TNT 1-94 [Tanacetum coccineum]
MHNNIMAVGSKDRPPMLGPGRYSQWRSRFLRYLDTKSNGEYLRKCIFEGPYTPTSVLIAAVEAAENILPVAAHEEAETIHNMTTENKLYFQAEKEAIFLILTGIGDEIYSTVDACNTTKEMWTALERLQQGRQVIQNKLGGIRICKRLALLANSSRDKYKPTNNNLRTSSNSRNKTEDTTPRYNNDNQSGQFGNQRTMTVAGARETVGSPVVQQNGIQCFNCKGFGHYARECRKPKRVKDYAYHKEKMMMCKQAEQGVPLQAEQADWLEDTDKEIDEQELEAHYSYMAKIQEVSPEESSSTSQPLEQVQNHDENDVFANVRRHSEQPESINDTYVLEKDDSNVIPDSSNICTNDNQVDQNAAECVDERDALANLIANLTLDTEENKTVLKQLKKANASLTQELKECKTNLDETSRALGEATSSRDSCLIALQTKQTELEKYTALNDRTKYLKSLEKEIDELESEKADFSNIYDLLLEECVSKDVTCSYLHSLSDLNANTELQCLYLHKVKECECLALKLSKQTESVNNEVHNKLLKSFAKLEKHAFLLELSYNIVKKMKNNPVCKENASNVFRKNVNNIMNTRFKAQMQDTEHGGINELKKLFW